MNAKKVTKAARTGGRSLMDAKKVMKTARTGGRSLMGARKVTRAARSELEMCNANRILLHPMPEGTLILPAQKRFDIAQWAVH